jgi:hypothetical protein
VGQGKDLYLTFYASDTLAVELDRTAMAATVIIHSSDVLFPDLILIIF